MVDLRCDRARSGCDRGGKPLRSEAALKFQGLPLEHPNLKDLQVLGTGSIKLITPASKS